MHQIVAILLFHALQPFQYVRVGAPVSGVGCEQFFGKVERGIQASCDVGSRRTHGFGMADQQVAQW